MRLAAFNDGSTTQVPTHLKKREGEQRGEDGTAYSDMQRRFGILIRISTYQVMWYFRATLQQVIRWLADTKEQRGLIQGLCCSTKTTALNKLGRG
jgi:hypothetical protein